MITYIIYLMVLRYNMYKCLEKLLSGFGTTIKNIIMTLNLKKILKAEIMNVIFNYKCFVEI